MEESYLERPQEKEKLMQVFGSQKCRLQPRCLAEDPDTAKPRDALNAAGRRSVS